MDHNLFPTPTFPSTFTVSPANSTIIAPTLSCINHLAIVATPTQCSPPTSILSEFTRVSRDTLRFDDSNFGNWRLWNAYVRFECMSSL